MEITDIERLLQTKENGPHQAGRPHVTLSYAQSLDGSIAARKGEPLAISGREARRLTHRLRATHEAILVGAGTVRADNPRLTVREATGAHPQPILLDAQLSIPLEAEVMVHPCAPWIATGRQVDVRRAAAFEAAGARLLRMPVDGRGWIELPALLEKLYADGIRSIMVEGGAAVIGSFLEARLVDWVVLTLAPIFIGGYTATAERGPFTRMPRLRQVGAQMLGEDLIVWGELD